MNPKNYFSVACGVFPAFARIALLALISFLFITCKKELKNTDNNNIENSTSSTSLIITGHNQHDLARVILVNIITRFENGTKYATIEGRLLSFDAPISTELNSAIKSTLFDAKKATLEKPYSYMSYFEDRIKTSSNYEDSYDIPEEKLKQLFEKRYLEVATTTAGKHSALDGEIDQITADIIKGGAGQAANCIGSGPQCHEAIGELAESVGNLWAYINEKVDKALNNNDSYSADDLNKDLNKTPPTSDPSGNNQSTTTTNNSGGSGDPHLTSMDGLYYDFQGFGEFIALKSTTDNFEVQVRQGHIPDYENSQVTVTTGLAINTGKDVICLYPNMFYINSAPYSYNNNIWQLNGGALAYGDGVIDIVNENRDAIKINLMQDSYFDYTISLNDNRKGRVAGLLGNFDGNVENDVQERNGRIVNPYIFGELYPVFANSWRVINSLFVYSPGQSSSTYTRLDFPKSETELDAETRANAALICKQHGITSEPYLSACIIDVGLSGSSAYAASALRSSQTKYQIKEFNIVNFSSFNQLDLVPQGNAQILNGNLYLTKDNPNEVGTAYKKFKVDISKGFEMSFSFLITNPGGISDTKDRIGGDGFAFIFQDYGTTTPLPSGYGLGYDGLPRSLAIEFDTYNNGESENPNDISLNTKGTYPNSTNDNESIITASTNPLPVINDGQVHNVVIKYTKTTGANFKIEVFMDNNPLPYLSADNINIQNLIGSYGSGVYIGFTASTAGAYENHIIRSWSFKTK